MRQDLGVTIKNEKFDHMFYHYKLVYSSWEAVSVLWKEKAFRLYPNHYA